MKPLFYFLLMILFLSLSCDQTTKPVKPTYGYLYVNSAPENASVLIDGRDTGQKTPSLVTHIETGSRRVVVSLENYEDWSAMILIKENHTDSVFAQLSLKPIILIVNSDPPGAMITVNGVINGMTTPDTIRNFNPGPYLIGLRKPGYFPYDEKVELHYGDTKTVFSSLVRCPDYALAYTIGSVIYHCRLDGTNLKTLASDYKNDGNGLVMSPDGKCLAYGNGSGIRVINSEGQEEYLIPYTNRANDHTWSHDSRYLVWGVYTPGIYRYDTETKAVARIYATPGYRYSHCPVYDQDDQRVAFVRHEWETQASLFVMKADGSLVQMTSGEFLTEYDENIQLNWAGDSLLVFRTTRTKGTLYGLYTFDLRSRTVSRVNQKAISFLTTSPDQQQYAYYAYPNVCYGPIGNWENPALNKDIYFPTRIAWSPESDFFLVRGAEGIYMVTPDQRVIPVVTFTGYHASGGLTIAH
ncbi:MAG: PEGA domain-containing protein [Patescibacteria group bacterium]